MSQLKDSPQLLDDLYHRDGHAWSKREADLLRQRRFSEVDWENVIEEIESVGKSQYRALKSAYRLVIQHCLKWQYQPERRSRSWSDTIRTQRTEIQSDEEDNRSLKNEVENFLPSAYRLARQDAAEETGLPVSIFPDDCPYTAEQLRDRSFLPD